jgi:hypothetical protein
VLNADDALVRAMPTLRRPDRVVHHGRAGRRNPRFG